MTAALIGGTAVETSPAEWMSRAEAAEYLGVTVRTLAQWAWRKEGPRYAKYGNVTRYRRADLDAFVASRFSDAT